MGEISLNINGKVEKYDVGDNTLLVDFIRENAGLTGTHVGCDTSQCGACVVHIDGVSVKACTILAAQAQGSEITTIEGIGTSDALHPMQEAFKENHGLQCGFCTPGMVMSAIELVSKNKNASEKDIRDGLEGNICRCTGYHNIVKSVKAGAEKMGG
jgi:carbon-monoxide dehydrogenase small subunit